MAVFAFLYLRLLLYLTATFEPFMNLRSATQDLRQLLFADNYEHFIFPAVSRRSESSVCLSKPFSVFNLNCFSGILSMAHPAALVSSRPGWIP